ncbi:hypothetical protein C5167_039588 [Papaver somniferum]|uniref:Uncharacterized protein n=1 Tax=Papaver somniferum TaxID=3469 RepID=A0A4Y7IG18_PAPSO|nr:hypothetical protein C5167_039588 [Papaver somniferum]
MRPKMILFGDSITEDSFGEGGWGASLAHHFSRSLDVILRGYSGYNTRWILKVIEKVCNGESPIAMTIFFGANDASLPDRTSAFQHVPLHEYKQNLQSIVSFIKVPTSLSFYNSFTVQQSVMRWFKTKGFRITSACRKWPTTLILLITPPPIDEDGRIRHPFGDNPSGLSERTNEAAGAYAKACVEVADECGVIGVDLWTKMQQYPNWEKCCLSDGLHLTPTGNKIVYEEVIKKLTKEGVNVETLSADLPLLSQIDPCDPLKAFQN